MKKRILTCLLALTLSISATSTSIFAAETNDKPFIYFSFGDSESAQAPDSYVPVHEVSENAPAVSMTIEPISP